MEDLLRDWRRWSVLERAVVPLGILLSLAIAVIGLSS
jgi:hypothetical protein